MTNPHQTEKFYRLFERLSGWREYHEFEKDNEGYITTERIGDANVLFFWRVDEEPVHLDHAFISGKIFVRYSADAHPINL